MAEMHEAQRLGFEPGPREMEEEADGYRFRATAELNQARKSGPDNRAAEERYLRLAQRDFDRARQLYEPIEGFSNVSVALRQVDDDDRARQGHGGCAGEEAQAEIQVEPAAALCHPEDALAVTKSWESNVLVAGAKGAAAPGALDGASSHGWRCRR